MGGGGDLVEAVLLCRISIVRGSCMADLSIT